MASFKFRRHQNLPLALCSLAGVASLIWGFGCGGEDPSAGAFDRRVNGQTEPAPQPAASAATKPPTTPAPPGGEMTTTVPHPPASDAGAPHDSAAPPPGASDAARPPNAGACAAACLPTGGGECGCAAKSQDGTGVFLGCSGDQCACLNGLTITSTFDAPNVCDSEADLQQAFANNCGCR